MEELFYQYNYPSIEKFKKILKDNNVQVSNQEITDFINKLYIILISFKQKTF